MRILDAHRAALDAQDSIGGIAQLEHVALQALDGEVLVHRADELSFGLEHDTVVGIVRNRTAGGDGREASAAPRTQHLVDGVAMNERALPTAARAEALGQHAEAFVELRAREVAVAVRPAHEIVKSVLLPLLRRYLGRNLLREDIERACGHQQTVQLAAPHGIDERRAFDELITRGRKQPALGDPAHRVTGASHALQEGVDRPRRADLTNEIHIADVDAELERGRRHESLELAALQALLGVESTIAGEAAVVGRHVLFAHSLGQMTRDALGLAARVDEHERGAVLAHELGEPIIDLVPHLSRHDRFERCRRYLEGKIAPSRVTGIDDAALPRRPRTGCRAALAAMLADQKARDLLDGLLRRRQSDARQLPAGEAAAGERLEALQRKRQMCTAFVVRDGVNLVDDHGAARRQHLSPRNRGEQDVERLRRRDQNVRGCASHARPLALRHVPGAHHRADRHLGKPEAPQALRRYPRSAPRDCAECRSTAPSAARRRRRASRRAMRPRSLP